jgi:hypothetical protein
LSTRLVSAISITRASATANTASPSTKTGVGAASSITRAKSTAKIIAPNNVTTSLSTGALTIIGPSGCQLVFTNDPINGRVIVANCDKFVAPGQ